MKDFKIAERGGTAEAHVRNLHRRRSNGPPDAVLLDVGVLRGADDQHREWNSMFLTKRQALRMAAALTKAAREVKP